MAQSFGTLSASHSLAGERRAIDKRTGLVDARLRSVQFPNVIRFSRLLHLTATLGIVLRLLQTVKEQQITNKYFSRVLLILGVNDWLASWSYI